MKQTARTGRIWHVIVGLALGLPLFALGQNYVFGPNVRVNDDSPGLNGHWLYSPGQHSIAARGTLSIWSGPMVEKPTRTFALRAQWTRVEASRLASKSTRQ